MSHTIVLPELRDRVRARPDEPWEPWQRLIDSIGPYYRTRLFAARDRARGELCDLDEEQLGAIAADGRSGCGLA